MTEESFTDTLRCVPATETGGLIGGTRTMNRLLMLAGPALLLAPGSAMALFFDNFNSAASAANYNIVQFGNNAVTFGWDYSTMGIPVAPNTTDGTTRGVKFESNMTAPGSAAAITLHTNMAFNGPYIVKFDAWINANGPFPAGGAGSTEFLTAGVGGDGTTVLRGTTGIGGWTAVNGEGGSGIDYRMYRNTTLMAPESTWYAAGSHSTARNANDPYYAQFGNIDVGNLPVQGANNGGPAQQTGVVKQGAFGFAWHEVMLEVNPTGGTNGAASIKWYIDNLLIGTFDAGPVSFPTNGRAMIGYWDPFASVSDNPMLSFGLIDNLQVVPEPSSMLLLGGGLALLLKRRKKS
jgi:hypothetical protein